MNFEDIEEILFELLLIFIRVVPFVLAALIIINAPEFFFLK